MDGSDGNIAGARRRGVRRGRTPVVLALGLVASTLAVLATPGPAAAAATDVSPFGSIDQFTEQQYRDLHGREPSGSELAALRPGLAAGTTTVAEAIDQVAHQAGAADRTCNVTRLYTAYFLRTPDQGGLVYWLGKARRGSTLNAISSSFATSSEFRNRYGKLSDAGFVDLAFRNVFGRPADPSGRAYWIRKLGTGTSRGQMMVGLAQSTEYQRQQAATCELVLATSALVQRIPTGTEATDALAVLADGGFRALVEDLVASTAWRSRFPVPGAVTGLTVLADDGQVVLRWTPPPTQAVPLTGYVVRPFIGTTAQPVRFVGVAGTATLTGLANGSSYRFEVVARNRHTDGPATSVGPVLVAPEARWTGYHGNAAHTGNQPVGDLPTDLVKRWEARLGDTPTQVLVADGLVYAVLDSSSDGASVGGRLYALSQATGAVVWGPVKVSGNYGGAMAGYEDHRVFLANDNGLIKALDSRTGAALWSINLDSFTLFQEGLTVYGGSIFTWSAQGLVAVNTANGQIRWTRSTMNDSGTPGADATGVYVAQVCDRDYRFTLTGTPVWATTSNCTGGGAGVAVPHSGKVWVAERFSSSPAIRNQSDGSRYATPDLSEPPALAGPRAVYNNESTIQGVTWSDGSVAWSQAGDGSLQGSPVINAEATYVASSEGMVYAFDLVTGVEQWSHDALEDVTDDPDLWEHGVGDLAIGGGLLLVPVGGSLVAYG